MLAELPVGGRVVLHIPAFSNLESKGIIETTLFIAQRVISAIAKTKPKAPL